MYLCELFTKTNDNILMFFIFLNIIGLRMTGSPKKLLLIFLLPFFQMLFKFSNLFLLLGDDILESSDNLLIF